MIVFFNLIVYLSFFILLHVFLHTSPSSSSRVPPLSVYRMLGKIILNINININTIVNINTLAVFSKYQRFLLRLTLDDFFQIIILKCFFFSVSFYSYFHCWQLIIIITWGGWGSRQRTVCSDSCSAVIEQTWPISVESIISDKDYNQTWFIE